MILYSYITTASHDSISQLPLKVWLSHHTPPRMLSNAAVL